jgi:hypothetical protein
VFACTVALLEDGPEHEELVVPEPLAGELYYTACAQIDRQNRCRQADLELDKKVAHMIGTVMYQREFYEQLSDHLTDKSFDSVGRRDLPSTSSYHV